MRRGTFLGGGGGESRKVARQIWQFCMSCNFCWSKKSNFLKTYPKVAKLFFSPKSIKTYFCTLAKKCTRYLLHNCPPGGHLGLFWREKKSSTRKSPTRRSTGKMYQRSPSELTMINHLGSIISDSSVATMGIFPKRKKFSILCDLKSLGAS